jgi:hypothetical protein
MKEIVSGVNQLRKCYQSNKTEKYLAKVRYEDLQSLAVRNDILQQIEKIVTNALSLKYIKPSFADSLSEVNMQSYRRGTLELLDQHITRYAEMLPLCDSKFENCYIHIELIFSNTRPYSKLTLRMEVLSVFNFPKISTEVSVPY